MERLTVEELERRHQCALACAGRAVVKKRAAYLELKKLVRAINSKPLDVSEYHSTARRLGLLLAEIDQGAATIFAHFKNQIDPLERGTALHFRFECLDLAEQIDGLEKWQAARQHLRRVK